MVAHFLQIRHKLKLILDNCLLEYCDQVKNLGLTMTKNLNQTEKSAAVCNRVFANMHSLECFVQYFVYTYEGHDSQNFDVSSFSVLQKIFCNSLEQVCWPKETFDTLTM